MQKEKRCSRCFSTYDIQYDICPHCGHLEGTEEDPGSYLKPGVTLSSGRYCIGMLLESGSFHAKYVAWDNMLHVRVTIKEYFPVEFSTRRKDETAVCIYSGKEAAQFQRGKACFLSEAKELKKCDQEPGIVKVYDSFEENNTSYHVMEYLEGTLLSDLLEKEQKLSAEVVSTLFLPILKSLKHVHEKGIIHGDIAPANIMITNHDRAKLMDFGASRHATTSRSRSLRIILREGYAAEEQYQSRENQKAYTDVYAIAATIYHALTGVVPRDSLERKVLCESRKKDPLRDIADYDTDLTEYQEIALMNALNIRPEDRTQDMGQFLEEWTGKQKPKRRAGKIRRMLLKWPLWAKIAVPAAAAGAISLGIGSMFLSVPFEPAEIPENMVRVPAVINTMLEGSIDVLGQKVLIPKVIGASPSSLVQENVIMQQNHDIGSYVLENTTVGMRISTGVENDIVPDVRGMYLDAATERMKSTGYAVALEEVYDSWIAEGAVVSQSIAADQSYDLDEIITLKVSKGADPKLPALEEKMILVPNLEGMTFEEAKKAVEEQGLQLAVKSRAYSDSVEKDQILYQSITPKEKVLNGNVIEVIVSLGKQSICVENVFCQPEADAIETLRNQGLDIAEVQYVRDNLYEKGLVIAQEPESGEQVDLGTSVLLTVSSGSEPFTVPNVTGLSLEEAKETLLQNGMVVILSYEIDDSHAENEILKQDLPEGSVAEPGDTITLTVNAKTDSTLTEIQDVTGKKQEEAIQILQKSKLQIAINEVYNDDVAAGHVVSQTPEAGISVPEDTVVTLTISLGKSRISIPDVTNKSDSVAKQLLEDLGMKVEIQEEYDDHIAAGIVIAQEPKALENLKKGSTVHLTVSKGVQEVSVPDVVGKTQAEATALLQKSKLSYSITEIYSDTVAKGTVISQTPTAGTKQKTDRVVTLVISKGKSEILPTSVALNHSSFSMKIGDTLQLTAKVYPQDASDKVVHWSSSNSSVVSVSENGLIQALQEGSATISVSTNSGGKTASCRVTVNKAEVSSIEISTYPYKLSYYSGESLNTSGLRLLVVYNNGSTEVVTTGFHASCNMSGSGKKTVQVTYEGKTATYAITVESRELTLSASTLTLLTGESSHLSASGADGSTITWSSSNSSVVSVSGGTVIARKAGTAVITASVTSNGVTTTAQCHVTVRDKDTQETTIVLSSSALSLYDGERSALSATVTPSDAKVSWSSSNSSSVMVSGNGAITAISPGSATITATVQYNGKTAKATCQVTVHAISVTIAASKSEMFVGETASISASASGGTATVSISSSNSAVVSVSGGVATANSPGTATITAQVVVNGITYKNTCTITVLEPSISLSSGYITLEEGSSQAITAHVQPSGAAVSWSSSNSAVASVSGGTITANSGGTATITAQIVVDGTTYKSTCTVTVIEPSISLSTTYLTLEEGTTGIVSAYVQPSGAAVSWSSSNSAVASVSGGTIVANSEGTATITAQITCNGITYRSSCTVVVTYTPPPVITTEEAALIY